jgi:hypothetical protein
MAWRLIAGYTNPGFYPSSEWQTRHLYAGRERNGLAGAFRKLGGRVLVDPDRLQHLIGELPEPLAQAAPIRAEPPPRRRTAGCRTKRVVR